MTQAESSNQGAAGKSGCGCSSKAAAETETAKACCGGHDHASHGHDHHAPAPAGVIDPVCGMTVDPATSKHRFEYLGETFHFCSAGCRTKFAADPKSYLEKDSKPKAAVPEGAIYTCPMHPQIRQVGPAPPSKAHGSHSGWTSGAAATRVARRYTVKPSLTRPRRGRRVSHEC